MNKKIVILCILLFFVVIASVTYFNMNNKVDSEVPSINSNIRSGSASYNTAITDINNNKFDEAHTKCNETLNNFLNARKSTINALNIANKRKDSVFIEYFSYTLTEIDTKINATNELNNGINTMNSNNSNEAITHFENSSTTMNKSFEYSEKRKEIEEKNPDKFTK